MAFDFKKEYREYYMAGGKPEIVDIKSAGYLAVRGAGDPNDADGEYVKAVGALYAIAYTLKMSKLGDRRIDGYYDYVVPPLEGFWHMDGVDGIDYSRKSDFHWISVIRVPDFVKTADFEWARDAAEKKKKIDCSRAEFITLTEGLCVQIMHTGAFDDEPASVEKMNDFISKNGYVNDITSSRLHHEIYLSDARKTAPEKMRTVIRHPIRAVSL